MLRGSVIGFLVFISTLAGFSQVSTITINKQKFFQPTIEGMAYLFENVDSNIWNATLIPLGITSLPLSKKVNALEYKKTAGGYSEYIGMDDRYWVLSIIWKDDLGKNFLSTSLKKQLKGKETNVGGTYRFKYKENDLIITIESNKDKAIYEMITMEIERK
jgi:hypothetical protein